MPFHVTHYGALRADPDSRAEAALERLLTLGEQSRPVAMFVLANVFDSRAAPMSSIVSAKTPFPRCIDRGAIGRIATSHVAPHPGCIHDPCAAIARESYPMIIVRPSSATARWTSGARCLGLQTEIMGSPPFRTLLLPRQASGTNGKPHPVHGAGEARGRVV